MAFKLNYFSPNQCGVSTIITDKKKMKRVYNFKIGSILFINLILLSFEANAQIYGEYQSARVLGKGRVEATVYYTTATINYNGDSRRVFNFLGLQSGIGLSERLELRIRYDRLYFVDGEIDEGSNLVFLAPKYSLLKDRISATLPIFLMFSEGGSGNWQLQPALLFSLPMSEKLELTFTPKYFISIDDEYEGGFISFNLGFAIGRLGEWAIRPETGLMFKPGEEGSFWNYGLGASRTFGKLKQ
jgi:hypothetical protein